MDHQSTGLLIHVASQQEIQFRQGDLGIFALPEPAEGGPLAGLTCYSAPDGLHIRIAKTFRHQKMPE